MNAPSRPHTLTTYLSAAAITLGLAACGGPADLDPEEDGQDALTTASYLMFRNVGTGNCMRRNNSRIEMATCDANDTRQRFRFAKETNANQLFFTNFVDGVTGDRWCVAKDGLDIRLATEVCRGISLSDFLHGIATPSRQLFSITTQSLTDFVIRGKKTGAGSDWCIVDSGAGYAKPTLCSTGPSYLSTEIWRQQQ
jgi:hypothetical protein